MDGQYFYQILQQNQGYSFALTGNFVRWFLPLFMGRAAVNLKPVVVVSLAATYSFYKLKNSFRGPFYSGFGAGNENYANLTDKINIKKLFQNSSQPTSKDQAHANQEFDQEPDDKNLVSIDNNSNADQKKFVSHISLSTSITDDYKYLDDLQEKFDSFDHDTFPELALSYVKMAKRLRTVYHQLAKDSFFQQHHVHSQFSFGLLGKKEFIPKSILYARKSKNKDTVKTYNEIIKLLDNYYHNFDYIVLKKNLYRLHSNVLSYEFFQMYTKGLIVFYNIHLHDDYLLSGIKAMESFYGDLFFEINELVDSYRQDFLQKSNNFLHESDANINNNGDENSGFVFFSYMNFDQFKGLIKVAHLESSTLYSKLAAESDRFSNKKSGFFVNENSLYALNAGYSLLKKQAALLSDQIELFLLTDLFLQKPDDLTINMKIYKELENKRFVSYAVEDIQSRIALFRELTRLLKSL